MHARLQIVLIAILLGCPSIRSDAGAGAPLAFEPFFDQLTIPFLHLRIAETNIQSLRQNPRIYVAGELFEGSNVYKNVAIHLKGSAGSFMPIDRKASFTLNMDKFQAGQTFHGMDKWHLNNSIQDPSYLNELICGELFKEAGVPCSRVTLALVKLNDRDLGLYVLKEGFDKTFLKRHFKNPDGNLYDAELAQDITSQLEKDSGDGPDDWSDLKEFAQIVQESNPAKRWKDVRRVLNVDLFIRFLTMEVVTWHWDGYAMHQNNYRLYNDPDSGFVFMPHGMDQMLWKPDGSLLPSMQGMVARSMLEIPESKELYGKHLKELSEQIMDPERLSERFKIIQSKIQLVLAKYNESVAIEQDKHAKVVLTRLLERAKHLQALDTNSDPSSAY